MSTTVSDAKPPEWIECTDDEGQVCYYNSLSQEYVWDKPPAYVQVPQQKQLVDAENAIWNICQDEQGVEYYQHTVTQESKWERPKSIQKNCPKDSSQDSSQDPVKESTTAHSNWVDILPQPQKSNPGGWIQVYDPTSESVYYYHTDTGECQWELPIGGGDITLAKEDPYVRAVIVIQCAYRSRKARRQAALARMPAAERLAYAEAQALTEWTQSREREAESLAAEATNREAFERTTMLFEEQAQTRGGDRFWGLELMAVEFKRQAQEEALMAEAEARRKVLEANARARAERREQLAQSTEAARLREEAQTQAREREAMSDEEQAQVRAQDRFWGLDRDAEVSQSSLLNMMWEDALSRKHAAVETERRQHRAWATEARAVERKHVEERLARERRYQKQYLKRFYRATSSKSMMDFVWPTNTRVYLKKKQQKNIGRVDVLFTKKDVLLKSEEDDRHYRLDHLYPELRFYPTKPAQQMIQFVQHPQQHVFHSADSSISSRKTKSMISSIRDHFPRSSKKISKKLLKRKLPPPPQSFSEDERERTLLILEGRHTRQNALPSMTQTEPNDVQSQQDESKGGADERLEEHRPDNIEGDRRVDELALLHHVFTQIDLDHSGSINRFEMEWALSKDRKVRKLAHSSLVLRPMLAKSKKIDTIFDLLDDDGNGNVSWDEFELQCMKWYDVHHQVAEQPVMMVSEKDTGTAEEKEETRKRRNPKETRASRQELVEAEEALAQKVFRLVDRDESGTIDCEEMILALRQNAEVRQYVSTSNALRPLLENEMFTQAFKAMDTDDDAGISIDEFVSFCTEMTSITLLNDL